MAQGRSCTVFIGNIPYDATEEELRGIFSRVGAVESLRLVYDKDTRQPKGYGFCDYTDPDTAMSAVRNLNDVECSGRHLRIDLADNALRSREGAPSRAAAPALPLPLPAPDPQPRPALPPSVLPSSSALPLPGPRLPGPVGAPLPPNPLADPGASTSPEAIIAAVSAHTEIAQTVAAMPEAQLQLCLGAMQRLAVEAPEGARALLQDHPQLCYALLHAQLLLGMTLEPSLPPGAEEQQQLRAEAARRPGAAPLPPGAALPGLPLGAAGLRPGALLRQLAPGLPGPPLPVGLLPTGLPGAPQPLGLRPDTGLAPKGWPARPAPHLPAPSLVPPRPGMGPALSAGAGG